MYDDRLYRTLDWLLPHEQAIEQHLVKRSGKRLAALIRNLIAVPIHFFRILLLRLSHIDDTLELISSCPAVAADMLFGRLRPP